MDAHPCLFGRQLPCCSIDDGVQEQLWGQLPPVHEWWLFSGFLRPCGMLACVCSLCSCSTINDPWQTAGAWVAGCCTGGVPR